MTIVTSRLTKQKLLHLLLQRSLSHRRPRLADCALDTSSARHATFQLLAVSEASHVNPDGSSRGAFYDNIG
jgi:hypothetical protein